MLRLFPLESGCGLDVPGVEPAERRRQIEDFFRRRAGEDPDGSFARYEAFGGSRWQLKEAFCAAAGDGVVPGFRTLAGPDFQAGRQRLDQLLRTAHRLFHTALLPQYEDQLTALPGGLARAVTAQTPGPEELCALKQALRGAWVLSREKTGFSLERLFFSAHPQVSVLLEQYSQWKDRKMAPAEFVPGIIPAVDGCLAVLKGTMPELLELDKTLGYDLAMAAVAPAAEAFLEEAAREDRCAPDDLLRRARDLVRDVPEVRAPLQKRFRSIYVDEFQDTDPVQAEFLFLLTHRLGDGERNWERCRPVPGSLFLVGDPKQAIYRFRRADLGVYKRVKALFAGGVGQVVQLKTNFRSNAQICAFTDLVFDPAGKSAPTSANSFHDDPYQAEYVPMVSEQGDAGRPMVFKFRTGMKSDPSFIAELIDTAVKDGYCLRDRSGRPLPLRYGDFLVLTRKKKSPAVYLEALSLLGVPVAFSGEQSMQTLPQVGQLEAWLRWLLEPDSALALAEVLMKCFGLQELGLLRQLSETYAHPLPALVFREEDRAVLAASELAPLRGALEETARVLEASRAMPPQAFFDWLSEEMPGRGGMPVDAAVRQRQYGCLRQVMQQIRSCPRKNFAQAARFALEQCQTSLERDLPLSPAEDCVRVMNLHKAKGLEGKVVILANDSGGRFNPSRAGGRYPVFVWRAGLYQPEDWEKVLEEEQKHYNAEQVRLNYVAATRAEQLLLISCHLTKGGKEGGSWRELTQTLEPLKTKTPREPDRPGETVKAVFDPPAAVVRPVPPAAVPVPDLVDRRTALVEALSAGKCRHVSPSTLDRSHSGLAVPDPKGEKAEAVSAGPAGADWGTMVHRVMELYVRLRPREEDALPLLQQAVRETLSLPVLSARQRALLFGGQAVESEPDYLTDCLWRSTRFWFDPDCPLRRLTGGGSCHSEYPFRLYLDDPSRPDQQLIAQYLGEGGPGPVSVTGILDLAVFRDGVWHIVDYKTDHIRPGESREDYLGRLTDRHRVQLEAYRQILARLTGQKVTGLWLCAIPLKGELIPIE